MVRKRSEDFSSDLNNDSLEVSTTVNPVSRSRERRQSTGIYQRVNNSSNSGADRDTLIIGSAIVLIAVAAFLITGLNGQPQSGAAVTSPFYFYKFSLSTDGEMSLENPRTVAGGVPGIKLTVMVNNENAGVLSQMPPENMHLFSDGSTVEWVSSFIPSQSRKILETELDFKLNSCSRNMRIKSVLLAPRGDLDLRGEFQLMDLDSGKVFSTPNTAKLDEGNTITFDQLDGWTIKLLPRTYRLTGGNYGSSPDLGIEFSLGCI